MKAEETMTLVGDHEIVVVKTNHARCPKTWTEEKMHNFPSVTWIVFEGLTKKEVDLLTIGYRYNKLTILTFAVTKG